MSATDRLDAKTAAIGAGAGVGAYLLGYLVTYVTHRETMDQRLQTRNMILQFLADESVASWQSVGWLFYNAHFVETVVSDLGSPRLVSFIADGDPTASALLYVVPPLLLLLAGVAVATASRATEFADGAVVGVTPALGYLPAAAIGVAAFTFTVGDAAAHPDRVTGVLLAGLVYPLFFGVAGGAIGGFVAPSD